MTRVCAVVPVYRNGPCLAGVHARLAAALGPGWSLRLVVDACPSDGLQRASELAARHPEVRVTALDVNVGQHRAIVEGLAAEPDADAWVCLDGDGQDPPEAVPGLLDVLTHGPWSGVFAGRTGSYQGAGRSLTGRAHRALLARIADVPPDAGAFFAMDPRLRAAVVDAVRHRGAPSVVAAAGRSGLALTSVPVARDVRTVGTSAWTGRARLRQGMTTAGWAVKDRVRLGRRLPSSQAPSSHGCLVTATLGRTPRDHRRPS